MAILTMNNAINGAPEVLCTDNSPSTALMINDTQFTGEWKTPDIRLEHLTDGSNELGVWIDFTATPYWMPLTLTLIDHSEHEYLLRYDFAYCAYTYYEVATLKATITVQPGYGLFIPADVFLGVMSVHGSRYILICPPDYAAQPKLMTMNSGAAGISPTNSNQLLTVYNGYKMSPITMTKTGMAEQGEISYNLKSFIGDPSSVAAILDWDLVFGGTVTLTNSGSGQPEVFTIQPGIYLVTAYGYWQRINHQWVYLTTNELPLADDGVQCQGHFNFISGSPGTALRIQILNAPSDLVTLTWTIYGSMGSNISFESNAVLTSFQGADKTISLCNLSGSSRNGVSAATTERGRRSNNVSLLNNIYIDKPLVLYSHLWYPSNTVSPASGECNPINILGTTDVNPSLLTINNNYILAVGGDATALTLNQTYVYPRLLAKYVGQELPLLIHCQHTHTSTPAYQVSYGGLEGYSNTTTSDSSVLVRDEFNGTTIITQTNSDLVPQHVVTAYVYDLNNFIGNPTTTMTWSRSPVTTRTHGGGVGENESIVLWVNNTDNNYAIRLSTEGITWSNVTNPRIGTQDVSTDLAYGRVVLEPGQVCGIICTATDSWSATINAQYLYATGATSLTVSGSVGATAPTLSDIFIGRDPGDDSGIHITQE